MLLLLLVIFAGLSGVRQTYSLVPALPSCLHSTQAVLQQSQTAGGEWGRVLPALQQECRAKGARGSSRYMLSSRSYPARKRLCEPSALACCFCQSFAAVRYSVLGRTWAQFLAAVDLLSAGAVAGARCSSPRRKRCNLLASVSCAGTLPGPCRDPARTLPGPCRTLGKCSNLSFPFSLRQPLPAVNSTLAGGPF